MVPYMFYKQNETVEYVASKVTSEVTEEVDKELELLSLPTGWCTESFIKIGQVVLKKGKIMSSS